MPDCNSERPPPAVPPGGSIFTASAFEAHCQHAEVLERRRGRPVVLRHRDASGAALITRIWYPRGRLSSDWLWPYRDRYRRALERLDAFGVRVPRLRAYGDVADSGTRFVVCEEIEGTPLRHQGASVDLKALAGFIARLHAAGVYFRGLHLGNVITCPDGELAVSDVQNVRFCDRPLPMRLRERNLAILCSHEADRVCLANGRWSELVMAYCRAAGMSLAQAARVRDAVRVRVQRRGARHAARRARRERGQPGSHIGSVKTP